MRILIDIGHPGHVHLFKNVYRILIAKGYNISVLSKKIDTALRLLDYYKIPYKILGGKKQSVITKIWAQFYFNLYTWYIILTKRISLGLGTSFSIPQLSKITKMQSICFDDDDDEMEHLFVKYAHRFSSTVLSPNSIKRKALQNISYNGTHELAYLHPNYFQPDESILKKIGITAKENFFILRFVALKGYHDVGHKGITISQKRELISYLSTKGKVFITSENPIESEFEQYRLPVPPEEIHSLLYFATMFLGDSQTMTSEAAILGTPALKCNTFAGKLSVPNELEKKYQLCYSFQPDKFDEFFKKTKELLDYPNLKSIWKQRKEIFLKDKIDVTAFFVWFIENYPESARIMKENPNYQYNFK